MGAEQSIPEQLYAASKRDDVEWLRVRARMGAQELCAAHMRVDGARSR